VKVLAQLTYTWLLSYPHRN